MSEVHDCGGDAAAYVLGALDAEEARRFRRHLDECAVCRDEVEALGGVVQALPLAAPQYPPPRRLRRRVRHAVRAEPRPSPARAGWPQARGTTLTRARGWPAYVRGWPAAAAAAAVLVAVVLGVQVGGGGAAHVIQARVIGLRGSAELRVSGTRGELIVRHLPSPPAGHVYEVWLKSAGAAPVPASVLFSVTPSGSADVGLPRSLSGVSQVMVTPEPDGGSASPTHTPVIVAELS